MIAPLSARSKPLAGTTAKPGNRDIISIGAPGTRSNTHGVLPDLDTANQDLLGGLRFPSGSADNFISCF